MSKNLLPINSISDKELFSEKNMKMVEYITNNVYTKTKSINHIDRKDIYQYALMGLCDVKKRYKPEKGYKFITYAQIRIFGYVYDEIRKISDIKRSYYVNKQKGKSVRYAKDDRFLYQFSLEKNLNSGDFEKERCLKDSLIDDRNNIEKESINNRLSEDLRNAIDRIPKKLHQRIIILYFFENLNMRDIGDIYKLTDSRICQIIKKSCAFLKTELEKLGYDSSILNYINS